METSSRWHRERPPHRSRLAPSAPDPKGGRPTHPMREGSPPQKATMSVHPELLTGILTQPFRHRPPPPPTLCVEPQPRRKRSRSSAVMHEPEELRAVLTNPDLFFLGYRQPSRTAPRDHQPPTAERCQPPTATNRQPLTAANCHQPPTTNRRQPPPTANRQQPTREGPEAESVPVNVRSCWPFIFFSLKDSPEETGSNPASRNARPSLAPGCR